jgi:hypothetical protein
MQIFNHFRQMAIGYVWGYLCRCVCLLAVVCSYAPLPALATTGYAPQAKSENWRFGQGVWYAPKAFTLYHQPKLTAPVLANVSFSPQSEQTLLDSTHQVNVPAKQCMLAFYPALHLGLMTVVGDAEDGHWLEVVWNHQTGETGWVEMSAPFTPGYLPKPGMFQTWLEFMTTHGKPAGTHWLTGVADSIKELHSQPDDYAKTIPSFYMQRLNLLHVKGNWMLMQGLDLERNSPIGWVRWREEDGKLLLFPNLDTMNNPWKRQYSITPKKTAL